MSSIWIKHAENQAVINK